MTRRDVLACAFERWSPRIGDPTAMGWATVVLYAVAAVVCAIAAVKARRQTGRERAFWWIAALILAFLSVNKQLDLQSFMTAIGRCVAQLQGWYAERRAVQREFVLALMAVTAVAMVAAVLLLRGTLRRTGLAALGLVFVCGFVLVRAVGFHHMDAFLKVRVMDLRWNWVLEMSGPILVIVGGLLSLRAPPLRRARRIRT